ncbi:MAG: DUF6273 domain-containing protein [Roseburia sp.]|nr:DUF6273 domain-containing protein [Roseburia sp.]
MKRRKMGVYVYGRVTALLLICTVILSGQNVLAAKAVDTVNSLDAGTSYNLKNPIVRAVNPPKVTSHGVSNPTNSEGVVEWDCIYFGNYPQSEYKPQVVPENPENDVEYVDKDGTKMVYKKEKYYKIEPIKWRVLSINGEDAFLLADSKLDAQKYDTRSYSNKDDITWENCTVRTWLNETFLNRAFTTSEQAAIISTKVVNEDDSYYSNSVEADTIDKVYLLSVNELLNPYYGFTSWYDDVTIKTCGSTDWCGANSNYGNDGDFGLPSTNWVLRSGTNMRETGAGTGLNSVGYSFYTCGVRPVLHLDLSSESVWSYAGVTSSEAGEIVSTWDCVWFGNYPQNEYEPTTAPENPEDDQEYVDDDGTKMVYKDGRYFKIEPIKWRVLSINDEDAFLLADSILDVQAYSEKENNTYDSETWKSCKIRTWLNNAFLNEAFTSFEQSAILNTSIVDEDTIDKVYLLSLNESKNSSYGFSSRRDDVGTRKAVKTDYAGGNGLRTLWESAGWWLRTPSEWQWHETGLYVGLYGDVDEYGHYVYNGADSVRPVLHLKLSSDFVWSYAGTVSSDGKISESEPNFSLNKPTPTPDVVTQKPLETSSVGEMSTVAIPSQNPLNTSNVRESINLQQKKITLGRVKGLKLKAKRKALQINWKKVSGVTGYEVQISASKKFIKKSTRSTKKSNLIVKKLKTKQTYFVRVRTYVAQNGKKTYGTWSKVVKKKVK